MKKLMIIAALMVATLSASAQNTLREPHSKLIVDLGQNKRLLSHTSASFNVLFQKLAYLCIRF